ncbi:hypothetical protein [Nocardia alba]|uniref:Uncharacterized protein n=1 Tax=Nocardia alba TaxID=225051 RepID=A0A4R1FG02_9NOCA|nr:hypothetical protein [Nocardia alba]TCJ89791.1 hypothetical protein DFR71_6430 [Nocardia alba]
MITEDTESVLHVEVEFTTPALCLHYRAAATAAHEFAAAMINHLDARVRVDRDLSGTLPLLPCSQLWGTCMAPVLKQAGSPTSPNDSPAETELGVGPGHHSVGVRRLADL